MSTQQLSEKTTMEQMGGWGETTMDIPCDRPAEMRRRATVCFGSYQATASERRVELAVVLIKPDLQS
jgi:hypothetical protein